MDQVSPTALPLQRSDLPGGPRLVLVHAPQAKCQTTFTFLPISLVNDDAGRAQWSHLLEHMLIRSTDAEGLSVGGVTLNGETTHAYLRLETFAEAGSWKPALQRHASWLAAREFEPERLEREKKMIEMEEQSTAQNGYTSKFALAAWNQAVTHGAQHIAVHGDVQDAQADEVGAYARAKVHVNDAALIASIGPIPVEQVKAEIERLLAAMPPPEHAAPSTQPALVQPESKSQTPAATQPEMLRMTWDLPTRHALFWWPLPDARPQTFAAASAICRAIHLRFLSNKQRAGLARAITPYACVRSGGQPMLVIDACLNAGVEADKVGEALQAVVADLADPASRAGRQTITFAGTMAARESPLLANFDAMSQQLPAHMKDFAEGVWLLGLMNIEYAWNAPVEEAQPMLTALDEQAVTEILLRLKAEPRGLSLEPKAP